MTKKIFPFLVFIVVDLVVFREFFVSRLLPIPGDILIGAYYPWLDYKWGYQVAVPVKNPMPSDVISFLYPWRVLGMDFIKSGIVPLWDSTTLLGQPLLANFQAAILNPLNILFFLLSNQLAWSFEVVLQPILGALAMYMFLRSLKITKWPAIVGGLGYAFSGFSIVWMEYNTIGFTLAVFPLVLFLVDKIIVKKQLVYSFLLALALCFQLLAGYPQISIYTIFFSSLYFGYRYFVNLNKGKKEIVIYFLGLLTFILLSAIQTLPSNELLSLSVRNIDRTAAAGSIQFLPAKHLITLFIPDFFGNPATANYYSIGSYDNFAFYVSPVILFYATLEVLRRKLFDKKKLIFLVFIVLGIIFATDNPINRAFLDSNFLQFKAAVSARITFIVDFAFVCLAALGLDNFLNDRRVSTFKKSIPLAIYLGIALGTFLSLAYFYIKIHAAGSSTLLKQLNLYQSYNIIGFRNILIPFVTVLLLTLGITILKNRKILTFLSIFLLIFTIVYSTDKYLSFINPKLLFPQTELVNMLQMSLAQDRFEKEKAQLFPSDINTYYKLNTVSGQNALSLMSVSKYLGIVNKTYPQLQSRFQDITNPQSPLVATLNIRYFLALDKSSKTSTPDVNGQPDAYFLEPPLSSYKNVGTVRVIKNNQNLGIAWFSKNAVCSGDETQVIKQLSSPIYNPSDLGLINCRNGYFTRGEKSQVTVEQIYPGYVKLEETSLNDNYLIFSMPFYPGWRVYLDNQETKLESADLALMSVLVPTGRHKVELRYLPDSFYIGVKVSLFTLVLWLVILGFLKMKQLRVFHGK